MLGEILFEHMRNNVFIPHKALQLDFMRKSIPD